MEQWLKEAKDRAKDEAKEFLENMKIIAEMEHIDREWFIDEVLKNVNSMQAKERKGE